VDHDFDRRFDPAAHRSHSNLAAQPELGYAPIGGLGVVLVIVIVLLLLGVI
jgi:hypothetical protein